MSVNQPPESEWERSERFLSKWRATVTPPRRFPPPWTIEEANDACFIVRDHDGQALSYVYFERKPGQGSTTNLLTKDEARRIAANITTLPAPRQKD